MRAPKMLSAGALALTLIPALPQLARAQEPYDRGPHEPPVWEPPEPQSTLVRVTPPAGGVVYLYEGRRLVGRFDRPGALRLPAGRSYRVVAMRGDQQVWSGYAETTCATLDLAWPRERWSPPPPPPPPAPPIEQGRQRTPW